MALNYTDTSGNIWVVDNYGNLQDARGEYVYSSTYTTTQDTLDSTSLSLFVGGSTSPTYLTWGTATATTDSQTVTGTDATSGISLTRKSYIADGYIRMLEVVTNTGSTSKTLTLALSEDIYYDSSTQTLATSSGDTVLTAADDWVAYGSTSSTNYPKLVHVVAGGDGSVTSASSIDADTHKTSYDLTLAAGETKVIVHYYALASDTAGAIAIGNSLSNLSLPEYLTGLTADELSNIYNFTKDFSSAVTTTLPSYGRNLTLTGTANINGTGNAEDNVITGNSAINYLYGLDGNDTLDGGAGADRLYGGLGNDTYIYGAGDTIYENANSGVDTVKSIASYSIANQPYLENITLLGSSAIFATGNGANNVLDGSQNSAANTLTGGLGNDTYIVGAGDIVVENVGEGTDTVNSSISYTLQNNLEYLVLTGTANINGTGNTSSNRLTGNTGNNTLTGGAGNDILNGGEGIDTLRGGVGNDTYYIDNAGDLTLELAAEGTDTVSSSINFTLSANIENAVLTGSAFKAVGNTLANTLTGSASDNYLDGGAGADTMIGGAGNDTYVIDNAGDIVTETLNQGIDTIRTSFVSTTLQSNIENGVLLNGGISLYGNELNNNLNGNLANNVINGELGNDTINGRGGNDTINGGDGDDVLIGDSGITEVSVASVEKVIDNQTVALNISVPETGIGSTKVTGTISGVSLGQTNLNVVFVVDHSGSMTSNFQGSTNVGDVNGDGYSNTVLDAALASIEKLNQSIIDSGLGNQVTVTLVQFDDTAEVLYSGNPNIDSDGNGSNDLEDQLSAISAGGGTAYNQAMTVVQNQLSSNSSGKNVVFFLSDGSPTDGTTYEATAALVRSLGQGGTSIKAIGMGAGASENPLDLLDDGIDNNSSIIVMRPEDLDASLLNTTVLAAAEGAWIEIYKNNVMVDLIGSDRFAISPLGVRFESTDIALSSSGTDTITAKLMTTSSTGAMIETSLPIKIGNFTSNDTLNGGSGNDVLDGGIGADNLLGGSGNDTYVVDNAGDQITEVVNEGVDLVRSKAAAYTLSANLENIELLGAAISATGNNLSNTLTGNALNNNLYGLDGNDTLLGGLGNDRLDGGLGNDTMTGGAGDDTYYVDSTSDYINEDSQGGISDTVFSAFSSTLGGYVSGETYSKSFYYLENLYLQANTAATTAIGSDQDNRLVGNSLDNRLFGLAGNDILNGGIGADYMNGGDGNDSYYIDNLLDIVIDSSGNDTIISSINDVTLNSQIENLTLANNSTILKGTGNSQSNILTGNSYNNTLDGMAGSDEMFGGAGNDIYYVDNVSDKTIEKLNEGIDLIFSSVNFKLNDNIENLTLTGSSGIAGAGNNSANEIIGNAGTNRLLGWGGNDILNGGAGADTMIGGDGSDLYYVSNTADIVIETNATLAIGGTDTVYSYLSDYTLTDNVEKGVIRISIAANITGNSLNNTLTGGTGANTLNGGAGADTMIGGDGSDLYYVSNTADIVIETNAVAATGGTDTVYSYLSDYTLTNNVENGVIRNSGTANLTGNNLNNTLTGNTGANTLTGGAGKDTMTGGAGADKFVFAAASVSGATSTTRDVITDFVAGTDKIDLSAIDADTLTAGNTAFTTLLSSSTAFTAAGQLKLVGNVLYGNTNNTAEAEFSIELTGLSTLGLSDFVL